MNEPITPREPSSSEATHDPATASARIRAVARKVGRDAILRKLAARAGPNTFATIASAAFGMVRSAILARALGIDDYGRLAVVMAAGTVVRQVFSVRTWEWTTVELSAAIVGKDVRRMHEIVRTGRSLGVVTGLLASATLLVAASSIATISGGTSALAPLVAGYGAIHLVASVDEVSLATLRVAGWFDALARLQIAAAAIRLISIVPLVFVRDGLSIAVAMTVLAQVPASVAFLVSARRALRSCAPSEPGPTPMSTLRSEWRTHLRTLATMSITDTIRTVGIDADPMVLGALASTTEVGEFKAASTLMMGLHSLATPLYSAFYPELARAVASNDIALVRALKRRITLLGLAFGGAAALGTIVLGPSVLTLVFGSDVAASAGDIRFMSVSILVMTCHWANPLFASLGRTGRSTAMLFASLAAKVACFVLLVPRYGSAGAAIGFSAYFLAAIVAAFWLSRDYVELLEARSSTTAPRETSQS